jgi:hypothetical protein
MTNEINLTFYRLSDRLPKDGALIMYVNDQIFNNGSELLQGEVGYVWMGVDEIGQSIQYHDGDSEPEGFRLAVCVDGSELHPSTFWAELHPFWDAVIAS